MSGKIVVAALGAICLALAIAGSAARNFYVVPASFDTYIGIGLWQSGSGGTKFAIDQNIENTYKSTYKASIGSKIQAAQAFGIIGALASTAAIAAGLLEQKKIVQIALFALAAFSGVIVLAVLSMDSFFMDGLVKPAGTEYGGAFGMCMLILHIFFFY